MSRAPRSRSITPSCKPASTCSKEHHVGVQLVGGTLDVEASTIIASKVPFAECDPFPCQGTALAVDAGDISVQLDSTVVVANSVLLASSDTLTSSGNKFAIAARWNGTGSASFINSVLYTSQGTGLAVTVLSDNDLLQVVSSAIACDGSATGVDNGTAGLLSLVRASVVVGCAKPFIANGTVYSSASTIEALSDGSTHTFRDVFVHPTSVDTAFPGYTGVDTVVGSVDDDWRCAIEYAMAGADTSSSVCGRDGASPCPVVVSVDANGAPRTDPISIGPFEVD